MLSLPPLSPCLLPPLSPSLTPFSSRFLTLSRCSLAFTLCFLLRFDQHRFFICFTPLGLAVTTICHFLVFLLLFLFEKKGEKLFYLSAASLGPRAETKQQRANHRAELQLCTACVANCPPHTHTNTHTGHNILPHTPTHTGHSHTCVCSK